MNIVMWSGPRNLSTAMMYAFGTRPDCAVWDEPFYAAYLARTGLDHPMAAEILAAGERDPAAVSSACAGPAPDGRPVFYQKHMAQHMLDGFDLSFMASAVNVFLIRHPARVIASYHAKRQNPEAAEIGAAALSTLYDRAADLSGTAPVVVDSADILNAPGPMLQALCDAIGLDYDPAMLSWPAGGHRSDGVWAPHWYGAVHRSTGFAGPEGPLPEVPASLRPVLEEAMPHYQRLRDRALSV